MALFNLGKLGKFYTTNVKCRNCGTIFELRIPKGITISDFVGQGDAKCVNCGCNTLNVKSVDANQQTNTPQQPRIKPQPLPQW